jgi:hypothetical protein
MPAFSLDSFPTEPDVNQLIWLIRATDAGEVEPEEFIKAFRDVHEAIEAKGQMGYASPAQGQLIWDVLWDLEYYSPDPSKEARPSDWRSQDDVMKTVKRVAQKLAQLPD